MLPGSLPWAAVPGGIMLTVRLTPKGGSDTINGIEMMADGRAVLKARVRAAPSDGEANTALMKLLARTLGVAPRAIELVAGDAARIKRLKVLGEASALGAALSKFSGKKSGAKEWRRR